MKETAVPHHPVACFMLNGNTEHVDIFCFKGFVCGCRCTGCSPQGMATVSGAGERRPGGEPSGVAWG